jgi:predicted outer membrane protein
MVRTLGLICVAAGVALLPALAQAQQAGQPPALQQPAARQADSGRQTAELTEHLAAWLAMMDHSEIELGQLAQKQADDPAVKEFAGKMVLDHGQHLKKLQRFMPTLDQAGRPGVEERTAAKVTPEGRIPQAGADGHSTMMQIGADASKRALEMTKEMLGKQKGRNFDMGFMAQQVIAHTHAVATLEAMQGKGSPEFRQLVDESVKATRAHLEAAQQIAMKINREEEVDADPER